MSFLHGQASDYFFDDIKIYGALPAGDVPKKAYDGFPVLIVQMSKEPSAFRRDGGKHGPPVLTRSYSPDKPHLDQAVHEAGHGGCFQG